MDPRHIVLELRCAACRRPQTRLLDVGSADLCVACAIDETNLGDKDALEHVLPFILEHRICAYCGEYGTDREHVIPQCTHLPTWTVFACRECNGMASGKLFNGFGAKRSWIRSRIRRKYANVLHMPEWTSDELAELGYRLRQYVGESSDAREWLMQRLNFDVAVVEIVEGKIGTRDDAARRNQRVAQMSALQQAVPVREERPEVLSGRVPDGVMAENPVEGRGDPQTHQSALP
jgi:hypothetical protein